MRNAAPGFGAVQLGQRHGGNAHLVGIGAGEESQPEDLETVRGGHAVELLIDGADQDLPPESLDGGRGLPLLAEPVAHRNVVQIAAHIVLTAQRKEAARDGQLVGRAQKFKSEE